MQSRYPYEPAVSWLFDELSDNASDDALSLSASVTVKQISKVILTLGNDSLVNQTHSSGLRLSIIDYKRPFRRGRL